MSVIRKRRRPEWKGEIVAHPSGLQVFRKQLLALKCHSTYKPAAVVLESRGRRYLMVQIAGAVARRIVCKLAPGDRTRRGERFGLIMFGSRVDLFLPADVRPLVARGDRVHAGTTVIAEEPA